MSSPTQTVPSAPPGRLDRWLRPSTPLERARLWLLLALVFLTVSSWALTIHQAQTMGMPMGIVARGAAAPESPVPASDEMSNMDDMAIEEPAGTAMGAAATSGMAAMVGGSTWDAFAAFFLAWAVMMAAMMFPAAAPMLLLFHRVAAQRGAPGGVFVPTWVFATGYLLVWIAVGAAAWALVQVGSGLAGRLATSDRATWTPLALGGVLIGAGLYQLTPLKRVCLDHCRTPIMFVTRHWRDGRRGALRMGIEHGAICLGCCWALFAVLVAAGVMSLAWMLLLTLIIFAEKVLPVGRWGPAVVGAAFVLLGVLVAAGATNMPWTI